MNSTQWTLINWIEERLPQWIVESTREPKEERCACSLIIASTNILATFKKTADPFYQAAYIYCELARKGHYFAEGNKRTAHCMAKSHLFSKGCHFKINYRYAVPYIRRIACGEKSAAKISRWLKKHSVKYQARTSEKY